MSSCLWGGWNRLGGTAGGAIELVFTVYFQTQSLNLKGLEGVAAGL